MLTADTITDERLRELLMRATVVHPTDDGARDDIWVCAKCGAPSGYRRKRPLYGYDMADAHCFTENCSGGVFCAAGAWLKRIESGKRSDGDRYDRNATIQLVNRALAGETRAREICAAIINSGKAY